MELDIGKLLLGINAILLAVIAWGGKWGVDRIYNAITHKVDKEDCQKNHAAQEKENKEIWERVNHHQHNGGGRVVIP